MRITTPLQTLTVAFRAVVPLALKFATLEEVLDRQFSSSKKNRRTVPAVLVGFSM